MDMVECQLACKPDYLPPPMTVSVAKNIDGILTKVYKDSKKKI
uniref:Uncharacterized protein n=1 Tax=Nelumbo nucifera TaxID=4432 RepID=A0A822YM48_NELNU|nr:TPA_asm: hypothetical protein HUJ06_012443 [Nelumbo nucifera]